MRIVKTDVYSAARYEAFLNMINAFVRNNFMGAATYPRN
jgi:hypothetical protein